MQRPSESHRLGFNTRANMGIRGQDWQRMEEGKKKITRVWFDLGKGEEDQGSKARYIFDT